jgi:predicted signal transduction protein with EAL and GGDEF domain
VGDRVLKIIAERLKSCVRETDIVSRFGGDEFIILLKNIKSVEEIVDYVERILSALKEEMVINGKKYYVSGSIGISVYPDNGADLDKLIVYADMAMYNSKENGKDRFSFYNEDTNVAAEKFLTFKNELLNAIKKEEFDIFFQPQYDKNGKYYGSEVLVRWHHPQKGFLTPDKFISYAVKLGIMDKIDLYVFKKAVNFYKELYSKNLNPGVLSFNVTVNQLHKKSFYDELLFLLKENEIDAEHLNLEITEESVMKNVKLSVKMLKSIKSLGMGISIDDFGTGYSSMAYLKKLPIDKIKIDKSFVENIPASRDDVIITKTIIHLAADLGMKIIAEGVKTYEQFDFLKNTGCDYLQGEYFSMPVDRDEFEKMLKENNDFK